MNHEVAVFAPGGRRTEVRAVVAGSTEFLLGSFRLPGVHRRVAHGLGFRSCLHSLRRAAPNVVFVHGFGPVSLLGVHFARRTDTPLLITWHTDATAYVAHYRYLLPLLVLWGVVVRKICGERKRRGFSIRRREIHCFAATLIRSADLVLVPSEKTAKKLRELSSETPIVTIPIGVDPIVPLTVSASRQKIAGPILLYAGRVAPEKGIGLLLDAVEILRSWRPDVTLVLAGDYRCARGLKRRLRAAHRRSVVLTGELERSDFADLYARADLFVFPSLTDTHGLVLQEAAHAGLPLVIVDSELQSPVADEWTTVLCEPGPHALAAAMASTLEFRHEALWSAAAGRAARSSAVRHSREQHRREITAFYQRYTQEVVSDG
jgi:1,2-diacylglycerol 3-alpha-glucosyltransferase